MCANTQRDGRPAEYRWCRLLKFAGVPQAPEWISAISGPKFTILWGHVREVLLFNKYYKTSLCLYSGLHSYPHPHPCTPRERLKTHPTADRATFHIPHITHHSAVAIQVQLSFRTELSCTADCDRIGRIQISSFKVYQIGFTTSNNINPNVAD